MAVTIALDGKVAIVTGGARGIGRAISLTLASAGADIVVADLRPGAAGETLLQEVDRLGRRGLAIRADVSKKADVSRAFTETKREFGRLDILVNNAGIGTSVRKPFYKKPEAVWDRTLSVDLKGTWLCSTFAAKEMIERRAGGRIVNISSVAGRVALRLQADYDAAKAGVIRLTEVMALELAQHGINVNCVAPGSTATDQTKALYQDPEWRAKMARYVPMGRAADPSEIASAVLFLCSDLSTYVTGHTLVVDGGWSAGAQIRDV